MIRDNAPPKVVFNYIKRLNEVIAPLNPFLIYLSQANIKDVFQKVIPERSTAWLEFFIDYYTQQGYGLENDYQGLEGTIEILKARKKLECDILAKLDINKEIIDNSGYDKQLIKSQLAELLLI